MNSQTTITNDQPIALILGSLGGMSQVFANFLTTKGVKVYFISPKVYPHTILNSQIVVLSKLDPTLKPTYVFAFHAGSRNSHQLITEFFKLPNSHTKITLITPAFSEVDSKRKKRLVDTHTIAVNLLDQSQNLRVVHLNHLVDPLVQPPTIINSWRQGGGVVASIVNLFPLSSSDACQAILKAALLNNSRGKVYELAGIKLTSHNSFFKNPTPPPQVNIDLNQLNATQQELHWQPTPPTPDHLEFLNHSIVSTPSQLPVKPTPLPNVSIHAPVKKISSISQTLFNPTPPPSIEAKPGQIKSFSIKSSPSKNQSTQSLQLKSSSKFKKILLVPLIILIVLSTISLPIFSLYNLKTAAVNLKMGDYQAATQHISRANLLKNTIIIPLNTSAVFLKNFGVGEWLQTTSSLYQISLSTINSALKLSQTSQLLLTDITTDKSSGNVSKSLADTSTNTRALFQNLSELEVLLNQLPQWYPFKQPRQTLISNLEHYRPLIGKTHELLAVADKLIALQSKSTYLILLQNSSELRPTGGFIGSFALVTFEKGKLLDLKVEDVYTADGQLHGFVEPPPPIKKHLGEASWYLRDVNWDPNFETTATRAAWFLEKELGIQVDGVIGLNLHTIQSLLEGLDPIKVADFNETITSTNLFERVEYQVEINQFPGSTQKRDFLGKIADGLLDQLLHTDSKKMGTVALSFISSLENNQLQLYSKNEALQQVFGNLNWDGKLYQDVCQTPSTIPCIANPVILVDANLGVNKANYFVDRKIDQKINITSKRDINSNISITYHNSSQAEHWPGGTYKNYQRVYLPKTARDIQIYYNKNLYPPTSLDISNEHDFLVVGFIASVPPGENGLVQIQYTIPSTIASGPFSLKTFIYKQPGTNPDPFTLQVNYPPDLKLANQQTIAPNPYSLTTPINSHQKLSFEFAP